MKKETLRKQTYVSPRIEVVRMMLDYQLLETSFPNNGGHKKAGDDGDEINDAKPGLFEDEDEANNPRRWEL